MKKYLTICFLALICLDSIACIGIVFKNQNSLLLGASIDQSALHGYAIVNKRNVDKFSFFAESPRVLKWTSKYGSITFSTIGKDFPFGGMNEEGLSVAIMTRPPMEYPGKDNRYDINESQWIQYILDNFSSTREAVNSDSMVRINRYFDNWHYLICDKNGDIAIIEFENGVRKVYSGNEVEIPVLENSSYEESVQRYKTEKDKYKLLSRFSQASFLLENLDFTKMKTDEPKVMFSILDNVRQDITKWQIVYDIQNRLIIYRANDYSYLKDRRSKDFMWGGVSERIIDLSKIDFTGETLAIKLGVIYVGKISSPSGKNSPTLKYPDKNFLPFNKVFDTELLKFNIEIFKSQGAKNITNEIVEKYIQFAKKEELVIK